MVDLWGKAGDGDGAVSLVPSVPLKAIEGPERRIFGMVREDGSPDIKVVYEDGSGGVVNFDEPEIGLSRDDQGDIAVPLTIALWRLGVDCDHPDHHVIGLRQAIMDELEGDKNGYGQLDTASVLSIADDLERIAAELRANLS